MKLKVLLGCLLVVPVALADVRAQGDEMVESGQSVTAQTGWVQDQDLAKLEPAAGSKRQVKDAVGLSAQQVLGKGGGGDVPGELKVLSGKDVAAYKTALRQARAGHMPEAKSFSDKVLWGHVKGVYLLNKKGVTFSELNDWMGDYRELALATEVYDLADDKRARPHQKCSTRTVTQHVKARKGHKATTKKVKKRVCHSVGKWGPAPTVPLVVEQREDAKARREAEREAELAKLSDNGRKWLGQSWMLRSRGDLKGAAKVLVGPGVRPELGNAKWQNEMVRLADAYHAKRDWDSTLKTATLAADVRGPYRDDALWLAGYAAYRLGNIALAAKEWELLVREESSSGEHYTRAAWWGAKALSQMNQDRKARELLEMGARDKVSFYGQLAAAKLGQGNKLDWQLPRLGSDDINALRKVPAARRALALAQIGEVAFAQREFKLADPDLPYQATHALAAVAVKLNLPGTALHAAKQLAERGEIVPAALYPLPEGWAPSGGWHFDRALMLGIMRQESAFQPQIGSRVGAQGLMQLMPSTAAYVARMNGMSRPDRADLHDPATNLALAQSYLQYLGGKLDGNMMLVVAAYNGGIGNVQRWLDKGVTPGHDPVLWLESIPFDETRDYVEKVFANYWLYQKRMGQKTWSLDALSDGYWPLRWSAADSKTKTS